MMPATWFSKRRAVLPAAVLAATCGVTGCANPGPPQPPSLGVPAPVTVLAVQRTGDTVAVSFPVPHRTADGQLLKHAYIVRVCRAVGDGVCTRVYADRKLAPEAAFRGETPWVVQDRLPPELLVQPRQLLTYRVELASEAGRAAQATEAGYTVSGPSPAPVQDFRVEGSRAGVRLLWRPQAGMQTVGTRVDASPLPGKAARSVDLAAPSGAPGMLDADAHLGDSYLYRAQDRMEIEVPAQSVQVSPRLPFQTRRTARIAAQTIELRSEFTPVVIFTWQDKYAPAAPQGLLAAPVLDDAGRMVAVDLSWQPVIDPRLAGYNVYRIEGDRRQKRNAAPLKDAAFRDNSDTSGEYFVTAVDPAGNESKPGAPVTVQP